MNEALGGSIRLSRALTKASAGLAMLLGVAVGISAGILAPTPEIHPAYAADEEVAKATASWLRTNVLPVTAVNSAYTQMTYTPGGANTATDPLNVSVLNGLLPLSLGSVPLYLIKDPAKPDQIGLLELGELGVLKSNSSTPTALQAYAASGLLGDDGGLQLSQYDNPNLSSSRLDLAALLTQMLGEGAQTIISEAGISIGAVGSEINAGTNTINGVELCDFQTNSQYVLTDLGLNLQSPLPETASTLINGVNGNGGILGDTVLTPLNSLIGPQGAIGSAVNGVVGTLVGLLNVVNVLGTGISASSAGTSVVLDTAPIINGGRNALQAEVSDSDSDGDLHINLKEGSIQVDLDEYAMRYAQTQNPDEVYTLNTLPPNTPALTSDTVEAILNGVTSILDGSSNNPNSLSTVLRESLVTGVYDASLTVRIGINIEVCVMYVCNSLANAPILVTGKLGQWMGKTGYSEPTIDVSGLALLGLDLSWVGGLLAPTFKGLITTIGSILTGVIDDPNTGLLTTFQTAVFGPTGIITTLLETLIGPTGYLRTLLDTVATVIINRQPDVGDLGAGSRTIRALEVNLLPGLGDTGLASVQLASSTVDVPVATCLTVTKTLHQNSQFAWANQARADNWTLSATHTATMLSGVTGSTAITAVPVPPGTYTLTEELIGGTATGGLPANAYQNTWGCIGPGETPIPVTHSTPTPGQYQAGTVTVPSPTSETVPLVTCTATNTLTTGVAGS